jgi:hypothetical protein
MQVTIRHAEEVNLLLDIINIFVNNAKRYTVYNNFHERSALLQDILRGFYFDLIDFCARCVRRFGGGSIS